MADCEHCAALRAEVEKLRAEVEKLRAALEPFADESLWSGPHHEFVTVKRSDCDRAIAAISASRPAPPPRDGFDAIPISNLRACVSDKCKNVAAYKMEFFNVGANYCQQCAGKIAELLLISLPPVTQVVRDFERRLHTGAREMSEVTHWMPLPPPPQKENINAES